MCIIIWLTVADLNMLSNLIWQCDKYRGPLYSGLSSQRASNVLNISVSWHYFQCYCSCVGNSNSDRVTKKMLQGKFVACLGQLGYPLQWCHNECRASQITSLTIVYSSVYPGADQRKHQSSTSLAIVRGIHWWPVNSPQKGPVMQKMFSFDDFFMLRRCWGICRHIKLTLCVRT